MKSGRSNKAKTSKGAGPMSKQLMSPGGGVMANKVKPTANRDAMTRKGSAK